MTDVNYNSQLSRVCVCVLAIYSILMFLLIQLAVQRDWVPTSYNMDTNRKLSERARGERDMSATG